MYPTSRPSGLGFWGALIGLGIQAGGAVVGSLGGGEHYEQWERDALPIAAQRAASTGYPVIVLWFGSIFRVDRSGTYSELVTQDEYESWGANKLSYFNQWKASHALNEAFWTPSSESCDPHNFAACPMMLMGNPAAVSQQPNLTWGITPAQPVSSTTPTLAGVISEKPESLLFPAIAIGGAILLTTQFKKGKRRR